MKAIVAFLLACVFVTGLAVAGVAQQSPLQGAKSTPEQTTGATKNEPQG